MSIRYIQTNYGKLDCDNILRFLLDLTIVELEDVQNYEEGKKYLKKEFVYLKENGIHKVFRCKVDVSSDVFVPDEWEHAMDTYDAKIKTVCNFEIKDNSITVDEENKNNIVVPDYKPGSTTVIIYVGKDVYIEGKDFYINEDNKITFYPDTPPLKPGDKVVIETTESTGQPDRLILLSDNGNNYEVCILGDDLVVIETDLTYSKPEILIGDIFTGDNYKVYMIDDDIYFEETDMYTSQMEIKVLDEEENEYKLEMIGGDFYFSKKE